MSGVVFIETLRRGWRGMLYWGIGIGLYGALIVLAVPDINALKQAAELMASLPAFIVKMAGGDDVTFMTTPQGYLAAKYFLFAPLLFGIYAINAGLNVTSNEEDRGILDVTLSLPIPRWHVVIERLLGSAVLMTGIVTITFLMLWGAVTATPSMDLSVGRLFQVTFNILPSVLLVMAVTVLAGAALRSRGLAIALAVVFLVGSYFIDALGSLATGSLAASLKIISFYSYYDSSGVMKNGIAVANVLLLLALAVVCGLLAPYFFQRRDIGV